MSDDKTQTEITFDWCRIGRAKDAGLEDLLASHWEEVALDQDRYALAPDWERYASLERQGVLRSIAAWRGQRLAGYNVFYVQAPIHYSRSLWALNDILYLTPADRRGTLGMRLIRKAEEMLSELGVKKIIYHSKVHLKLGARKTLTLGSLLARMGYTCEEEVFSRNV
jgi:GNAT superfamily N-acetyltransferase